MDRPLHSLVSQNHHHNLFRDPHRIAYTRRQVSLYHLLSDLMHSVLILGWEWELHQ
uniref:Uncharacterized protein n=1 Tax=uncultured marine virus TaxID=186617 RepID=A0A0F7LBF5_9VIRU|nr:hypothetical protein [uncultured marine virus]